jgi:hypothetical protein
MGMIEIWIFLILWVYLHNRIKLAEDFGHFIIC